MSKLKDVDRVQKILDHQPIYLNLEDIRSNLKLGTEELNSYFNDQGIEIDYSQTYDVIDIMKYFISILDDEISALNHNLDLYKPDKSQKSLTLVKEEKIKAQTELYNLMSEIKSIKLKLQTGEFILAEKVVQDWGYNFVKFKAKLEAIPSKIALQLSSVNDKYNCENIVLKLLTEALVELREEH